MNNIPLTAVTDADPKRAQTEWQKDRVVIYLTDGAQKRLKEIGRITGLSRSIVLERMIMRVDQP